MITKRIASKDILKGCLDILGVSASAFSKLVGKDPATLSRYLSGLVRVPEGILIKAMQLLLDNEVSPTRLLQIDNENEFLFHATNIPLLGAIDTLRNQNKKNDFGPGFYLGETLLQSTSFQKDKSSPLNIYMFDRSLFSGLKIYDFKNLAPLEWLIYIAINRDKIDKRKYDALTTSFKKKLFPFQAVRGKIADSFSFQIIEGLFSGIYDLDQAEVCTTILALGDELCIKDQAFAKTLSPSVLLTLDVPSAMAFGSLALDKRARQESITKDVLSRPSNPSRSFRSVLEKKYGEK